ncbi:MAG: HK97 family phage prohead protease [Pirellulales bacterium]
MEKRAGMIQPSTGSECRSLRRELAGVKIDRRADNKASFKGLAAVYYRDGDPGTEYWLWNDMVERIIPGAFDRAIKEQHDARGLFNHDANQLLGRVSAGTLALSLTSDGLAYDIPFDQADSDHQRVAAKIDRGDVNGSSFAFIARAVQWEEVKQEDGSYLYIRTIKDVDLYDVGPVTWPAYEATTAGRSGKPAGSAAESRSSELQQLIAERESYLRKRDDEAVAMRVRTVSVS